jgi:hypothetical protein
MPLREHTVGGYSQYTVQREEPRPAPGLLDTVKDAMYMENDVLNAWERMNRPVFPVDDNFDLGKKLQETNLWERRDDYLGVRSDAEFDAKTNQIVTETQRRQRLAEAGWPGVIASIAAGTVSPTIFIPLIGPGLRGAKAAAYSASLAAMSAGAQEGVLLTSQQTRTGGEVAFSVAASTILGGILGGAVSMLKKTEFDKLASDMAPIHGNNAIYEPVQSVRGESVGAAYAAGDSAGKLAPGYGNKLAFVSPVTRLIQQETSPVARAFAHAFSDAGMKMEGAAEGIAAAPGGNIESLIKTYAVYDYKGIRGLDEHYADYMVTKPGFGRTIRAHLSGMVSKGKMTRAEFNEEVTKRIWSGEDHAIPEVNKAAAMLQKEIYDPLLKEAQAVGLLPDEIDLKGDLGYTRRMFNTVIINARQNEFVELIAKHYEQRLNNEFLESFQKFSEKAAKDKELLSDLSVSREQADELRAQFLTQLEEVEQTVPDHLRFIEDDISMLRGQLRNIPDSPERAGADQSPRELREALRNEIAQLETQGGDALKAKRTVERQLKRRLANLNRSRVAFENKQAAKLERLERIDELSQNSLNRAVRAAGRFLKLLDRTSPKEMGKEISKLKTAFAQAAKTYDNGEEQIVKLRNEEGSSGPLANFFEQAEARDTQAARFEKMTDIANRLDEAENFDNEAWKEAVNDLINESLERVQNITLRRGARAQRLLKDVENLDPKLVDERIAKIANRAKERKANFADHYRMNFGVSADIDKGIADFSAYAKDLAVETKNKILKINDRIQFNDLIREKRGPEIARMLDIPSAVMADYLEKDAERLLRLYVKTMGSDIPLAKVTGSANAAERFADLEVEYNARIEAIGKAVDKEGKPLSQEAKEKLQTKAVNEYKQVRDDMIVLLQRARRTRGVPDNPTGMAQRMVGLAMNLNTMRFMGGVVISSIPDIARPIQKFGLTRVFRDGFVPLIRDLKAVKMSQREAHLSGSALDIELHSRAQAFSEINNAYARGSKLERAAEFGANKMGVLALFDYWTVAWKKFTAGLANVELLESMSYIMEGGTAKQVAKAQETLARSNLTPDIIETIWKEMQQGGGAKVRGVWMPQTELWNVADPAVKYAQQAYYAALNKYIDDTIITPGFERPAMVDANLATKMLFQFKSFGLASTTKTMMAGLQENDLRFANGVMISLALGALSYYLWATATGGKAYEEMLNADIDKFADEAISRSGQLAGIDLPLSVAQRIPGLSPFLSFSGTRSSRREGGDLSEAILGPSFDLLEKAQGVLMGIDDPTEGTLNLATKLAPLQNHFLLGRIFDAIVTNSGLPESRQ